MRSRQAGEIWSEAVLGVEALLSLAVSTFTLVPTNIPCPTPYPLDNWLSLVQFCHTLICMCVLFQRNQTCPRNTLLVETIHLFLVNVPLCSKTCSWASLFVLMLCTSVSSVENKLLIRCFSCVFRGNHKCCWSLSIVYYLVNSESVTYSHSSFPPALSGSIWLSAGSVELKLFSSVVCLSTHRRSRGKSDSWLQTLQTLETCKIWAICCPVCWCCHSCVTSVSSILHKPC